MFGEAVSNRRSIPGGPGSEPDPREARLDPNLHRVARGQLAVDRGRREPCTADRVRHAVFLREPKNDRPVDAVSGWRPVASIDVADELLVRVAPLRHAMPGTHDRQPGVGKFLREQLSLADALAVVGE